MSTKNSESQIDKQDIGEVIKNNFDTYFQEAQKVMPQYMQSFTTLQESFLSAWRKTINSSIKLQKEYAEEANIETSIPQEYTNIIQSIGNEFITAKDVQNKSALSTLEVMSNNLKNQDDSFETVATFNKQFLNYWANLYSKK